MPPRRRPLTPLLDPEPSLASMKTPTDDRTDDAWVDDIKRWLLGGSLPARPIVWPDTEPGVMFGDGGRPGLQTASAAASASTNASSAPDDGPTSSARCTVSITAGST
jgi:hypothetical protein